MADEKPKHIHAYGRDACPHPDCANPGGRETIEGLRAALLAISQTAEGRRHYSPDEQYQALGDIRKLADDALTAYPAKQ